MLKDDIKDIIYNNVIDNTPAKKVNEIVCLLANDYWKYDKNEIVKLSKEIAYCLLEVIENIYNDTVVIKRDSYVRVLVYLKEYYLRDE